MRPGLSDPFWAGLLAKMLAIAGIVVAVSAQRLNSTLNQGATPMLSWRCPGSSTKRARLPRPSTKATTLQGQPQGGSDVPIHQNSDPVSDESEILRSCQPLTGKCRCTVLATTRPRDVSWPA